MAVSVRPWLDNAILQSVAESYLHLWKDNEYKAILLPNETFHSLELILSQGVNHPDLNKTGTGATRLTTQQIEWFKANYKIVYHYPNDASGFSATLFKNIHTNEYTLSFRSTEYQLPGKGGDWDRDGSPGADGDVSGKGFALAQLSAMETFYANLQEGKVYNPATHAWEVSPDPDIQAFMGQCPPLTVTGYSLGAHMATAFALMHPEVSQTFTYNAAGLGGIDGGNVPTAVSLSNLITLYDEMMAWDGQGDPSWLAGLPDSSAYMLRGAAVSNPGLPTDQSIYDSYKYQVVMGVLSQFMYPAGAGDKLVPFDGFGDFQLADSIANWLASDGNGPFGLDPNKFFSDSYTITGWNKIQQIYGHGEFFDPQMVANSGYHAPATPVWVEDLPTSRAFGILELFGDSQVFRDFVGDFGETHSITPIIDSLTVLDLLQGLDSSIGNARFTQIMKAMSNRVDTINNALMQDGVSATLSALSSVGDVEFLWTPLLSYLNTNHLYDGDAMENFVNALTKIFTGTEGTLTQKMMSDGSADPLGYADITKRNELHVAIQKIHDSLSYQQSAGLISIDSLVSMTVADMALRAKTDMGFRYALNELLPFAISGDDGLYAQHNAAGDLDFFDPVTGEGVFSDAYLKDRATMLLWKIKYDYGGRDINDLLIDLGDKQYGDKWDTDNVSGDWNYVDLNKQIDGKPLSIFINGKGDSIITADPNHQIIFGSSADEFLAGQETTDHLYGMAGDDTLTGNQGNDYLEGGKGIDTYIINAGDGYDTILDTDGQGVISLGGVQAKGSATQDIDPKKWVQVGNTWKDQVNGITYDLVSLPDGTQNLLIWDSGNTCTVEVKGWSENELGIKLGNGYVPTAAPLPTTTGVLTGDPVADDELHDTPEINLLQGLGGNDDIFADAEISGAGGSPGVDVLDGGEGDDLLISYGGGDVLIGGNGSDILSVLVGPGELYGGNKIDDLGAYIAIAETEVGNGLKGDWLNCVGSDDTLVGANGNDILLAGNGADVLIGGGGDDYLDGDNSGHADRGWTLTMSVTESNGSLSFSSPLTGAYFISSPSEYAGADTIYGGAGNDWLMGRGGNDVLDGGADDDAIWGNEGNDILNGGAGNDVLIGDGNSENENDGADNLYGGSGDDTIEGQGGNDLLDGGEGNDLISGGSGDDTLYGGPGDDDIPGGMGNDYLEGGAGSDSLYGWFGNDTLVGDSGDYLDGGDGDDTYIINGQASFEIFDYQGTNTLILNGVATIDPQSLSVTDAGAGVTLNLGDGQSIQFSSGVGSAFDLVAMDGSQLNLQDWVSTNVVQGLSIYVGEAGANLNGGAGNDTIYGGAGVDHLYGNAGNDQLYGYAGDDFLDGGTGNDYLSSTSGNNTLKGGDGNDTIWGGVGNDLLLGGEGDDELLGFAGLDTLIGGAGNDLYYIQGSESVLDNVMEMEGEGTDTIWIFNASYVLPDNFENLYLDLAHDIDSDGTGNSLDNYIGGNGGNNLLSGNDGNDTLSGGGGLDTLVGGSGNDSLYDDSDGMKDILMGGQGDDHYSIYESDALVIEAAGEGNDCVSSFLLTYTLPDNVEQLDLAYSPPAPEPDPIFMIPGSPLPPDMPLPPDSGTVGVSTPPVIVTGIGNDLDNQIWGNEEINILIGGNGADWLDGKGGADSLDGGAGADYLWGGAGDDYIDGGDDNDRIIGWDGNDELHGGNGNDSMYGGSGNDLMSGGSGDDLYIVEDGGDAIVENADEGNDVVISTITSFSLPDNVEILELAKGGAGITGIGNEMDNTIQGNSNANVLKGMDGADWLFGWEGNDTLYGGSGDDVMHGMSGDDVLVGDSGCDVMSGEDGNDFLNGGTGADDLMGGTGNDVYVVDDIGDAVSENGSEGTDTVWSYLAAYTLADNVENGRIMNIGAADLTGNVLNNTLVAGQGDNMLDGGNGVDTVSYFFASSGVNVSLALVSAQTTGGSGTDTLISIENLNGSIFPDILTGDAGNNVLYGDAGADTLAGGGGNDAYYVDDAGDVVIENADEGTDVVRAGINYTLGNNVENLMLLGSAGLNGTGNTLNNSLIGNAGDNMLIGGDGNDYLKGGVGNDTLIGGAGNDIYEVDSTGDVINELANEGTDSIQTSIDYMLGDNIENLVLLGTAGLSGTGNTLNNSLIGNAGDNIFTGADGNDYLKGGVGNDTLIGGTGSDTYEVDSTGDVITELANEGADTIQTSIDYMLGDNIENLLLLGSASLNGTGNTLNNSLVGNNGNNMLDGNAGNDYLKGGAGNDTLDGGVDENTDIFVFDAVLDASTNLDTLLNATFPVDQIQLDNDIFTALAGSSGSLGLINSGMFFSGSGETGNGTDAVGIYYDMSTGKLYYNPTTNTVGDSVAFATINGTPTLSAAEFTLVE